MARTLDSIDSGSNYSFGDKLLNNHFPRSLFDLSHLNTMTVPNAGYIFPVWWTETLPTDSMDLSITALLRVLAQVVPLYSRQRLYFHAFYCRCGDLWKSFNTYMKKGKDGNLTLTRPSLTLNNISSDGLDTSVSGKGIVKANSIWDYMGIPVGTDLYGLINSGYHIDALPFMALLNIYRWYYINKNAFINDNALFPHDDADFRLNDSGLIQSYVDSQTDTHVLGRSMPHLWPQDYFTSALPFPQRGDAPTLPLSFPSDNTNLLPIVNGEVITVASSYTNDTGTLNSQIGLTSGGYVSTQTSSPIPNGYKTADSGIQIVPHYASLSGQSLYTNVVLDDIRRLAISQLELERMARTDGTYEEFGITFYNISSKDAIDYKPVYIGGSYQDVSFSEVLQTVPTNSSPLGAYGGHGVSVTQNGSLGHVECDDYGYIFVLASIMPDVYYHQGLSRFFTKSLQSEEFLPNRDRMGLRPILNQELYLSGNYDNDNDLFAYQNPFDEYRYVANEIHGQIADPTKLSFYPYTQARHFDSTPNWNNNFLIADNVRKDYLAASIEDAYTMQVRIDCRAVRPLSYVATPAEVIN